MGLVKKPIAVFSSILGFTRLIACLYGLKEVDDELDELICEVIKKANGVIFCLGYIYPDKVINNPSALTVLIIEELLYKKAKQEKLLSDKSETIIWLAEHQKTMVFYKVSQIYNNLLNAARSVAFESLKMKSLDGLSLSQIVNIFNLQKQTITEEEVRFQIKQGLAGLRYYTENPETIGEYSIPEEVESYAKLLLKRHLTETDREEIKHYLIKGLEETCFDFWLNEIHYFFVEEWYKLSNKNTRLEEETLRSRIEEELEKYLQNLKSHIDKDLVFCKTASGLEDIFWRHVEISTESTTDWRNLDWNLIDEKRNNLIPFLRELALN